MYGYLYLGLLNNFYVNKVPIIWKIWDVTFGIRADRP